MAMLNYQRVNSASKTSIFHNQTLGKKRLRSSDGFFCYTWNVVRRDLSTRQCLTLECRRCSELAYVFTPFGWFLLVTFMIFCLNRNVWSLNTNFRSLNILFHRSITILLASKFHHHFFSCWIFIYIYVHILSWLNHTFFHPNIRRTQYTRTSSSSTSSISSTSVIWHEWYLCDLRRRDKWRRKLCFCSGDFKG